MRGGGCGPFPHSPALRWNPECLCLPSSVGPLHSDLEYTVSSQKEGYILTAVEGTVGHFKAYALAGVSFEVKCSLASGSRLVVSCERPWQFWGLLPHHHYPRGAGHMQFPM